MCIVSMMHDHYRDRFVPWFDPNRMPWTDPFPGRAEPFPRVRKRVLPPSRVKPLSKEIAEELEALRPLIAEYKEALAKAKRLDELTQQPNCADPKKAELEARVAELERKLEDMLKRAKQAESIEALSAMLDGDGDEP